MLGQEFRKIKAFFSCLVLNLVLLTGCDQSNLDYVIHSQQRLHRQIIELRQSQKRFVEYTLERIDNIRSLLVEKEPNFKRIPRKWKSNIEKIEYRHNALRREFNILKLEAETYFKNLERLTKKISVASYKKKETKSNKAHKTEWYNHYDSLEDRIFYLERLIQRQFEDLHKVLLAAGMKSNRQNSLSLIKEIKTTIKNSEKTLIADIKALEDLITKPR